MTQVSKINGIPIANTVVTGFTYDNVNTFVVSNSDSSNLSASILNLSSSTVFATSVSATTFYSGITNLNDLLGGGTSHNKTYVQQGTNIYTGGTEDAPTIGVTGDPVFNSVTATTLTGGTIYSGGTNVQDLFALTSDLHNKTYIQNSPNIITGGTEDSPTLDFSSSTAFQSVTINNDFVVAGDMWLDNHSSGGLLYANAPDGELLSSPSATFDGSQQLSNLTATTSIRSQGSLNIEDSTTLEGDVFLTNLSNGGVLFLGSGGAVEQDATLQFDASVNVLSAESINISSIAGFDESTLSVVNSSSKEIRLSSGHYQSFSSTTATTVYFTNTGTVGTAQGYSVLLYGAHPESVWYLTGMTSHGASSGIRTDGGILLSGNTEYAMVSVDYRGTQNHIGGPLYTITVDTFSAMT